MFVAYLRTFARMGLKAIPMRAATGPIGGDLSHEFIVLAETGESEVFCHKDLLKLDPLSIEPDYARDLEPVIAPFVAKYAATDEKHDAKACPVPPEELLHTRGIEVGHIFYFGTKYSKPMNAKVQGPKGEDVFVEMGSYGIGVSRLVGGIIEACHDEAGIIWPDPVAPFKVGLINIKADDDACRIACDDIYGRLRSAGIETIYDDTDARAGAKFATMDLIGVPWQVAIGPRGVKAGTVELKRRATGEKREISAQDALAMLAG
jgi:prolyl-tRNA synthetase